MIRLLMLALLLIIGIAACGQQEETNKQENTTNEKSSNINEEDDGSTNEPASTGIVAGKLEATIEVSGSSAEFQIKNQTEKVQELILSGKTSYQYVIKDADGKIVFEKAKSKPQYEQKKPITLKQAESIVYSLKIPNDLKPGEYHITAVLHSHPKIKASTSFTIE